MKLFGFSMNIQRRKMIGDMLLNIVSNALPIFVLQFIVQPFIARELGADENGRYLTLMSLLHCAVMLTGTTLHMTRLLREKEYKDNKIEGDFNLILLFSSLINIGVICIGSVLIKSSPSEVFFTALLSVIWMIKDYVIVEFRLKLTYSRLLINNLLLCVGYILGVYLFRLVPKWYIIIISGYFLSFIHLVFTTELLKEPIKKTSLFKGSVKVLLVLSLTEGMSVFMTNYDRFVLFALITGSAVSVYYSASIMGKMMSLLSAPVSNVILSYLVSIRDLSKRSYHLVWIFSVFTGVILYFVCVLISPWILRLLYPQWANDSLELIYFTCGVAMFSYMRSIASPFILKFCDIRFQWIIKGIHTVIYGICGYLSIRFWGIKGFAICNLFVSFIICVVMFFVGETQIKQRSIEDSVM